MDVDEMTLPGPVVLGNWKMHGLRADGLALAGTIAERAHRLSGTLGVFPPATLIQQVARRVEGTNIIIGAQDCHESDQGAFTGSISAPMIRDAGGTAVILGHSERRHGLGETSAMIARKTRAARGAGLLVVLCIGETEAEYLEGSRDAVLASQIEASLPEDSAPDGLVIAYEPVWAIGTGRTPTVDEIAETHAFVQSRLVEKGLAGVPILYGGSVKPENAADILSIDHVDGALVGGASLDAQSFWSIYTAGGGT
jgi:triosephosphate isomerase